MQLTECWNGQAAVVILPQTSFVGAQHLIVQALMSEHISQVREERGIEGKKQEKSNRKYRNVS